MSAQTIKLNLVQDAMQAYPDQSINDALYLFLLDMYNSGQCLPDLIAKYSSYTFSTEDLFIQNGRLIQSGVLTQGSSLWSL